MKVNEFLEKYCLHDSTIDEISYDSDAKELFFTNWFGRVDANLAPTEF